MTVPADQRRHCASAATSPTSSFENSSKIGNDRQKAGLLLISAIDVPRLSGLRFDGRYLSITQIIASGRKVKSDNDFHSQRSIWREGVSVRCRRELVLY